ncbi:hypothetical protein [Pseudalkalibacillus caeni]|uniref:Uncharacterized protein n=1 Tax=Exobacillus caeni TaxID=2574798 RepID=A0A5R9EZE3_9BACL|nr:hypothetical protein [Pseudalkalibacillus caeni]TLS35566.1 hypothetical protein FCL54_19600 [Pseudalkalibacillus caeni]
MKKKTTIDSSPESSLLFTQKLLLHYYNFKIWYYGKFVKDAGVSEPSEKYLMYITRKNNLLNDLKEENREAERESAA